MDASYGLFVSEQKGCNFLRVLSEFQRMAYKLINQLHLCYLKGTRFEINLQHNFFSGVRERTKINIFIAVNNACQMPSRNV